MKTRALAALVAILSLAAPVKGQAGQAGQAEKMKKVMQLGQDMNKAMDAGEYGRAVDLGKEAAALFPGMPQISHKVAMACAMNGDHDEAINWIRRTISLIEMSGITPRQNLLDHDAFKALKERRDFAEMRAAIQAFMDRHQSDLKAVPEPKDNEYVPQGCEGEKGLPMLVLLDGLGGNPKTFASSFRKYADGSRTILLCLCGGDRLGMNGDVPAYGYDWKKDAQRFRIAIVEARDRLAADPDRVYVLGFSQGAIMATALGLNNPEIFRGVISVAGAIPETLVDRDALKAEKAGINFYVAHGSKDQQRFLSEECAKWLAEVAGAVEVREFDGGHSIPDPLLLAGEAVRWLDSAVKKETDNR